MIGAKANTNRSISIIGKFTFSSFPYPFLLLSQVLVLLLLSITTSKNSFVYGENNFIPIGSQTKQSSLISNNKSPSGATNKTVEVKWMTENVGTIQCYVCSWSVSLTKYSETTNESSIPLDICSHGKFIPEASSTTNCVHGCQAVGFRTSEKEGLQNFYRNCLKADPGDTPTDRCIKSKTFYGLEERCECLSSLCNGATGSKMYKITIANQILTIITISSFILYSF